MISARAAGIDIGAARSAVAVWNRDGRTRMIPDPSGRTFTPTVVRLAEREILVGEEAARSALLFPSETAQWIKRELGAKWYSRPIRGRRLPPEVILACVLRKLREDAERETGGVHPVAAAVPWYFDDARRKATADALEIAGWQSLGLINEPTAAVLALAESLGRLQEPDFPPMRVLVYDLGGATFKTAVMRLKPGGCRTLAADAELQLGGYDWDVRLVEWLAEQLGPQGLPDPRYDAAVWSRVYPAAVEAKHTLSTRRRAELLIEWEGRSYQAAIDRQHFEEITADLLSRTRNLTERLLKRLGIGWDMLDGVLAVGGEVRMPAVSEMLERLSGKPLLRSFPPDELVARGAAIFAEWLCRGRLQGDDVAGWRIRETASRSLWVETRDPHDGTPHPTLIVPVETVLPVEVEKVSCTEREGQLSLAFRVWEGGVASDAAMTPLGEVVVTGLPPDLPRGRPIRVIFRGSTDGRWDISAEVPGTDCRAEVALRRDGGLDAFAVRQWRDALESSPSLESGEGLSLAAGSEAESPESQEAAPIASGPPVAESLGGKEHPRLAAAEKLGRRPRLQLQPLTGAIEKEVEAGQSADPREPPPVAKHLISTHPVEIAENGTQIEPGSPLLPPEPMPLAGPILRIARPTVTRDMLLGAADHVLPPQPYPSDIGQPVGESEGEAAAGAALRWDREGPGPANDLPEMPIVGDAARSGRNRFRDPRVALPWGGSVPRWVIGATGFVVSSLVGLWLGYWFIRYLLPESPLLRIWP